MFDKADFEAPPPPLFSVQEITRNIRSILEKNFSFIGIQGEISSFTPHSSGHWYFNLKDLKSQIKGVMFRSANQKMSFQPRAGEEVIVWGKATVYAPRGEYQIVASKIEKRGHGALQKAFEELKEKLKNEGLFERKTPLPYLPKHIAVITSPGGAAVKDVLNVLKRRCRGIQVTISPALMEGDSAVSSVILALEQALKLKDIDLVLITRGGGSAESLWTFNDEALVRKAFECPVPLVSAIGHEIDFTLLDFAADFRAPTPSAAAEIISKNGAELLSKIQEQKQRLKLEIFKNIRLLKKESGQFKNALSSPLSKIQDAILRCGEQLDFLKRSAGNIFDKKKQAVKQFKELLLGFNPERVMSRGYTLCFKGNQLIREAGELSSGDTLQLEFCKGRAKTKVIQTYLDPKKQLRKI